MVRKYLQIGVVVITFFIFIFLGYFVSPWIFTKHPRDLNQITDLSQTPPKGVQKEPYNFLLLGYGGKGHDGGFLSDVVIVVHLDLSRKQVSLISIPRDLWVEIPVRSDLKQNYKINAAYAIGMDDTKYPLKEPQYKGSSGAATLTKRVISDVTGLQIANIIAVDFDSFKRIVDTLGGLEVNIPVTFDDYFYPVKGLENETCGFSASKIAELHQKYSGFELEKQFECRYEHLHFEKGTQKMDGETTLKFVRSRHSSQDGGDFARSRRQDEVLTGIREKLLSLYAIKKIDELYDEFKGLVTTDLELDGAKKITQVLGLPKDYKVSFIRLSEDNVLMATKSLDGQFILIPKDGENVWVGLQRYIHDQVERSSEAYN